MKCFFDGQKECPMGNKSIPFEKLGRFCQACIGRDQMSKALGSMKVMRAQLILGLLTMFPKDEEKAKQQYQKLMRYAEEW